MWRLGLGVALKVDDKAASHLNFKGPVQPLPRGGRPGGPGPGEGPAGGTIIINYSDFCPGIS